MCCSVSVSLSLLVSLLSFSSALSPRIPPCNLSLSPPPRRRRLAQIKRTRAHARVRPQSEDEVLSGVWALATRVRREVQCPRARARPSLDWGGDRGGGRSMTCGTGSAERRRARCPCCRPAPPPHHHGQQQQQQHSAVIYFSLSHGRVGDQGARNGVARLASRGRLRTARITLVPPARRRLPAQARARIRFV